MRSFTLPTVLLLALMFVSCDKEKEKWLVNNKIIVKESQIMNLPPEINMQRVSMTVRPVYTGYDFLIDFCDWDNGFTLDLGVDMSWIGLWNMAGYFDLYDAELEHISFSDLEAQGIQSSIRCYGLNDDGGFSGSLGLGKTTSKEIVNARYWYIDRPFRAKGILPGNYHSGGIERIFDLDMKKGWNLLVTLSTVEEEYDCIKYTTKVPAGLQWSYYHIGF